MPSSEPQILINPAREHDAGARPAATGGSPADFHRRLPGYAVTRVVSAPALAAELGLASLSVKDEAGRLGMPSFKILGVSWAVYRLLVSRLGSEPEWNDLAELRAAFAPLGPLQLVAATDGNHGRAVAHMAHLLGYDVAHPRPRRVPPPRGSTASRAKARR